MLNSPIRRVPSCHPAATPPWRICAPAIKLGKHPPARAPIDTLAPAVGGTPTARTPEAHGLSLLPRLVRTTFTSLGLILPVAGTGCSVFHIFDPLSARRGALIEPDAVSQLVPGTSTRADATSLLGSPTARATFDDNTWIYISQITKSRIGRTPGVTSQHVLVLQFDPSGTLRSMHKLDKADGKEIAMAPGATPSPGSEAGFMQQLIGNVGKFTPAGLGSNSLTGPGNGPNTGVNSLR
jgi:outer membrane protein assembly factor BamE (lipoprotein component of BamABCDE complex)